MKTHELDANSPLPLYHQLKNILKQQIQDEEWPSGTLIPTEPELMEMFSVSRTTVREAVAELVNEGLLEKKQGKGTFVKSIYIEEDLTRLSGFAEEVLERGSTPSAKLIRAAMSSGPLYERSQLGLPEHTPILCIERIRLADGEPIAYERSCWPEHVGDFLQSQNLDEAAFYKVLEEHGIYLKEADETIRAVNATQYEAELLGVSPGEALLEMRRISFGEDGSPIECTRTKYRADRYSYKIHLKR